MFGTKHIIVLICTLALIVGLFLLTRKWSMQAKYKGFFVIGILSEIVKVFFYIIKNEETMGGILPKSDLPFQLCSIQIIFGMIVLFSKNENVKNAIMCFMYPSGLIGGFAAILIPTVSAINYWVITLQYFIYHAALITLALHIVTNKEHKLTLKDYVTCLVFILALMFFSIYINSMMYDGVSNFNFMYVVSPPVDGLPFLNKTHGWLTYIMHYATIVLVSITLCYIKPIIIALKDKFSKSKEVPNKEE